MNKIKIKLTEKSGNGHYANIVLITHTAAEFVLDFTRLLPGMTEAEVSTRVIIAPQHMSSLVKAITDNIEKFETKNGQIREIAREEITPEYITPKEGELPN